MGLLKQNIESQGFLYGNTIDRKMCFNKLCEKKWRNTNKPIVNLIYNEANSWMLITIEQQTIFAGFVKTKEQFDTLMEMLYI